MRRVTVVILSIVMVSASAFLLFRRPNPQWNHSPDATIVYTSPGLMHIDFNYVPDVLIRGNGRIVWVERASDGGRHVLAGSLTGVQVSLILETSIDAGVSDPLRGLFRGGSTCAYAGADNQLVIALQTAHAAEPIRASDAKICALIRFLADGAGAEGSPYLPQRGLLYPIPLEETDLPIDTATQSVWPADSFSVDLQAAYQQGGEYEISGEALAFAWEFVNRHPDPVVTFEGEQYWLGVQLPDLLP